MCALACRFEVLAVARRAARLAKARRTVDALTNYDVLGLQRDFSRDALKRSCTASSHCSCIPIGILRTRFASKRSKGSRRRMMCWATLPNGVPTT